MKQIIRLAQDGATGLPGEIGQTGLQGIQGQTGAQGLAADAMHFMGAVTSNSDFTTIHSGDGPANGDFYTVTGATVYDAVTDQIFTQGDEIVWSTATSAWVLVGRIPDVVQGETGAQGVTGLTGVTGLEGAAGVTGAIGETGAPGLQGETGLEGTQGATGINGIAGLDGATGVQGLQGDTGLMGNTGLDGAQGVTGLIGETGASGDQGVTGLIGETGLPGSQGVTGLVGATGAQGAAADVMHFRGVITQSSDFTAIPIAGRENGDFYAVTGTATDTDVDPDVTFYAGDEIVWNYAAQEWVLVGSSIVVAQGETGIRGETGIQGITGLQGATGLAGADGVTGLVGETGLPGIQGETGTPGVDGATGVAGIDGATGIQGQTGAQGLPGSKWTPSTLYTTGATVFFNGVSFAATSTHTSAATFDLDLDKWESMDNDAWIGQQVAHGFNNLQAAYRSSTGTFTKAQADAEGTLATHLVVYTTTDHLLAVASGDYTYTAHGLTGIQYCSPGTAGALTHVQPDPAVDFINPVVIAQTVDLLRVVADQPAYFK